MKSSSQPKRDCICCNRNGFSCLKFKRGPSESDGAMFEICSQARRKAFVEFSLYMTARMSAVLWKLTKQIPASLDTLWYVVVGGAAKLLAVSWLARGCWRTVAVVFSGSEGNKKKKITIECYDLFHPSNKAVFVFISCWHSTKWSWTCSLHQSISSNDIATAGMIVAVNVK